MTWVATQHGFFSCTCPETPQGDRDDAHIQIRARLRAHIPAILKAFPEVFKGIKEADIQEDAGTDYRFRIIVNRETYVRFMAELALDNHAHNFKNEVSKRWGPTSIYNRALHDMWHTHYEMQEQERRVEKMAKDKAAARIKR